MDTAWQNKDPCALWEARYFLVSLSKETISSWPAGKDRKPYEVHALQWPWAGALLPGDGLDYSITRTTKSKLSKSLMSRRQGAMPE